jgi:hypothetical protein
MKASTAGLPVFGEKGSTAAGVARGFVARTGFAALSASKAEDISDSCRM